MGAHRWQKPRIALALYSMSALISMRRRRYRSAVHGNTHRGRGRPEERRGLVAAQCTCGYRGRGAAMVGWLPVYCGKQPPICRLSASAPTTLACPAPVHPASLLAAWLVGLLTPEVSQQLILGGSDGGAGGLDAVGLEGVHLQAGRAGQSKERVFGQRRCSTAVSYRAGREPAAVTLTGQGNGLHR